MAKKSEAKLPERLEDALQELEVLVEKLESPELPLEDSIELFERGSKLSQLCYQKLQEAEKKVQVLIKKNPKPESDDDFELQDFEPNGD